MDKCVYDKPYQLFDRELLRKVLKDEVIEGAKEVVKDAGTKVER